MPKLWNETIDEHRRAVHEATLDAAANLVAEQGLISITMVSVAEKTGISRATLYKYFPSVESILLAWHERHVQGHLEFLETVRDGSVGAQRRLEAVLKAYAFLSYSPHTGEIASFLHRGAHFTHAQEQVNALIRDLIVEGVAAGAVRSDLPPDELVGFCMRALTAAKSPTKEVVLRLVLVILDGLSVPR